MLIFSVLNTFISRRRAVMLSKMKDRPTTCCHAERSETFPGTIAVGFAVHVASTGHDLVPGILCRFGMTAYC